MQRLLEDRQPERNGDQVGDDVPLLVGEVGGVRSAVGAARHAHVDANTTFFTGGPNFPWNTLYRYRVRGLRDALCPRGWSIDRTGGLEGTKSSASDHVILTRGGNEDVGLRDGFPQPRSIVGESTRGVVENGNMLFDPNWLNTPATKPANDASYTVWLLLVYRSGDIVQAEMSWPNEFNDEDGQVKAWIERILVGHINMTDPTARSGDEPGEPPMVIDVPLPRKR